MPPRRPRGGRMMVRMWPSASSHQAVPRRSGAGAFGGFDGEGFGRAEGAGGAAGGDGAGVAAGGLRGADAGGEVHQGLREIAGAGWGEGFEVACGSAVRAAGSGVSMAKRRVMTRSTLPSMTMAWRPKAKAAMAAAV